MCTAISGSAHDNAFPTQEKTLKLARKRILATRYSLAWLDSEPLSKLLNRHTSPYVSMLFKNRFTIAKLMWIVALVAVILGNGKSWTSFYVLQLLVVSAISEILILQFPTGIANLMNSNCIRLDGSISVARKQVETTKLRNQRIFVILLLMALSLIASSSFWFVASGTFASWEEPKKADTEEIPTVEGIPIELQIVPINPSSKSETLEQQFIKQNKYILCFLGLWFIVIFLAFKSAYFFLLRQLFESARARSHNYRLRDMERMMEASDHRAKDE